MNQILEYARRIFFNRTSAYRHVFDRKNVYLEEVLKDLARFCRAHDTAFHPDPRLHAMLEGRREVWLRIQRFMNLSAEELWALKSGDKTNE